MRILLHVSGAYNFRFVATDHIAIDIAQFLHEVRSINSLSRRKGTNQGRLLQRSHNLTLSNRQVQNESTGPAPTQSLIAFVERSRIREPTRLFSGNVYAEGLFPQTKATTEFIDSRHVNIKSCLIKEDVTTQADCIHHIQTAVRSPALLITSSVLVTARTGLRVKLVFCENSIFKPGTRRH